MEIDRKTLKALAADTRLDILKSLGKRRKMPSELSKEMSLAPSTILEHLNKLEKANLVRREKTGHKWVYYNLTNKGESLVKPKYPVQFVLMLSLGIFFVFSGALKYIFNQGMTNKTRVLGTPMAQAVEETAADAAKEIIMETVPTAPTDWLMIGLVSIGIILIAVSLILRLRKK
ncbi:MAG: winged helix-turn-helix domain-containing protein [Candidatus Aenigmatarchaeota archaeon]